MGFWGWIAFIYCDQATNVCHNAMICCQHIDQFQHHLIMDIAGKKGLN